MDIVLIVIALVQLVQVNKKILAQNATNKKKDKPLAAQKDSIVNANNIFLKIVKKTAKNVIIPASVAKVQK